MHARLRLVLLVLLTLALPVAAAESTPEANLAITEAQALLKASLFDDALAAADRAVKAAPKNPEALKVRAQARVARLRNPAEDAANAAVLDAALADYDQALALLGPSDPGRASVAAERTAVARRKEAVQSQLAAVEQQQRQAEAQRLAAAQAEQQRQEQTQREEAARQRAAQEAYDAAARAEQQRREQVRLEHAREEEAERQATGNGQRGLGIASLAVGGAGLVGMVAFLAAGGANNERIKRGGFDSAGDIVEAEQHGLVLNGFAAGFGIAGGVFAALGAVLIVTAPNPPPAKVTVRLGPAGVQVAGNF